MIKIYNFLLPAVAVFLVAAFMHIMRVQQIELNMMLSLMLIYLVGMTAGIIFYTFKEESTFF